MCKEASTAASKHEGTLARELRVLLSQHGRHAAVGVMQGADLPCIVEHAEIHAWKNLTVIFACIEAAAQGAKTVQMQQQVAQLEAHLQDASAGQKAASDRLDNCKTQLSHCKR